MFHRIFSPEGHFIMDIPWQNDSNGGLPEWFFELNLINIEVDIEKNTAEWIPPVGPAPCWKTEFSRFENNEQLFKFFYDWALGDLMMKLPSEWAREGFYVVEGWTPVVGHNLDYYDNHGCKRSGTVKSYDGKTITINGERTVIVEETFNIKFGRGK